MMRCPAPWTPAQEAALLEACKHLHRVVDVADALGSVRAGTTKNAVIGKIARMRKRGHVIEMEFDPPTGRPLSAVPRTRRTPPKPRPQPDPPKPPPPKRWLEPRDRYGNRIMPDIPMRRLTLMQLARCQCRWPLGDGPFLFCGNDAAPERSYCAPHHQFAHGPGKA